MLSQQNQWQNQRLKQPHQLLLLSQLLVLLQFPLLVNLLALDMHMDLNLDLQ